MKQKQMKGVCLLIAGILFLLLFFSFSGIEKTKLLDTDGRNFEKAEVTNFLSEPHRSVSVSGRCMALKFCKTPFEHILSKTQNPKFLTLVILTRNMCEVK